MTVTVGLPPFDSDLNPMDRVVITHGVWRAHIGYLVRRYEMRVDDRDEGFWRMSIVSDMTDEVLMTDLAERSIVKSLYQGEALEHVDRIN